MNTVEVMKKEAIRINEIVAPAIRQIINERGLKQCAVAKKAGYTKQQFNAMLTGRKLITDIDISRIIIALDIDANALFSKKEGG